MADGIGIIILAGGKSSRMGTDKGLLLVNNKPIMAYLLETCQQISEEILIVSNTDDYAQFGYPIVKDTFLNIGPMGGVQAGLSQSKSDVNLVLSCDVPLVSVDLLMAITKTYLPGVKAVFSKHNQTIHPLIGLYHRTILKPIADLIKIQQYRLIHLCNLESIILLDLSHFPEKEFLNLNTKDDLANFKRIINES